MQLIKIYNKKKVCKTKDGKDFHPTYYVLELDKMNDGLCATLLINFPNIKNERKLIDAVSLLKVKE